MRQVPAIFTLAHVGHRGEALHDVALDESLGA